ncbi:substrate-binding domain-containing protein [Testudinibacter sp. P27/CKL/0425]
MKPLIIFSAGSFKKALQQLNALFQEVNPCVIQVHIGPAGLLRERIEKGERCDIFISANEENITKLARHITIIRKKTIAFNQLGITTLNNPEYQNSSPLELLLNPKLRLGISTPGSDPCGDYAYQLFALIEKLYPGKGILLKNKAHSLVGGENTIPIPKGEIASQYLLENGYTDVFLGYSHYAKILQQNPRLQTYSLPKELIIIASYPIAQLTQHPYIDHYFQFLNTPRAQTCIQNNGFQITASSE